MVRRLTVGGDGAGGSITLPRFAVPVRVLSIRVPAGADSALVTLKNGVGETVLVLSTASDGSACYFLSDGTAGVLSSDFWVLPQDTLTAQSAGGGALTGDVVVCYWIAGDGGDDAGDEGE